jgi:hypothetical protein
MSLDLNEISFLQLKILYWRVIRVIRCLFSLILSYYNGVNQVKIIFIMSVVTCLPIIRFEKLIFATFYHVYPQNYDQYI